MTLYPQFFILCPWLSVPDLQEPRLKIQLPKPRSNLLQIHRGMEHGSRLVILGPCGHDQLGKEEIGQLSITIRVWSHVSRVLILGPRGYAKEPKGEESSFMSLGPCGHDYYDYWGKGGKANKKGPRSSNLGPRRFSICSLDTHHTHSQSSDHNVC